MISAAFWIGAIGAFHLLISPQRLREIPDGFGIAARSLNRFSLLGTICVLVIAATGLINSQMIVGAENPGRSLCSPFGPLLSANLALLRLLLRQDGRQGGFSCFRHGVSLVSPFLL